MFMVSRPPPAGWVPSVDSIAMIIQGREASEFEQPTSRGFGMAQDRQTAEILLRESVDAERALIDAETSAERELQSAEKAYRRALERLEQSQQRVERRRREFEQARAKLDQCQLERAAGPLIRHVSVARPSLPRPARDDSRLRTRTPRKPEPAPEGTGSDNSNSGSGR